MPRYNYIQTSFLAGELGAKLEGRVDLNEYLQGAKEITNGIVMPQGGIHRRQGTEYITNQVTAVLLEDATTPTLGATFDISEDIKIIPFNYAVGESYIIIIGHDTANSESWIAILNAADNSVISSFSKAGGGTDYPGFKNFNSVSELADVKYAQSGDILWMVHPNHPPIILQRTSATAFTIHNLGSINPRSNGIYCIPYQPTNTTTTTITTTGTGATRTLTASSAIFTDNMDNNSGAENDKTAVFKTTDTAGTGDTLVWEITGFTSPTVVTGTLIIGDTAFTNYATADWQESSWNGERGYPRCVSIFEQRVYFGGTEYEPDTVWASQTGDLFELDSKGLNPGATTVASDAFQFTVVSGEVNQIQWLSAGSSLSIGTLGREYIARGAADDALSATSIQVTPETAQGSSYVQPVRVENTLTFAERSGQRIREFIFNRDENAYRANDLTYLNDDTAKKFLHGPSILGGEARGNPKITEMQYQSNDFSVLWVKNNFGALAGLTRGSGYSFP